MKIGILTFHRSINYGAFMQSYALANEIRKRFGDIVEVIDFEKKTKHQKYARPQYGLRNWLIYGDEYKQMYRRFQEDLGRLPLSRPALITDDYNQVFDYINGRYDIVVVGSDAVWSYQRGLGLDNPYWLFGDKLKCIKMSYAASAYGLDFRKVSDQEKEFIAEHLKSFAYIGVRDNETKRFIESIGTQCTVNLNCDPTILLERPDKDTAQKLLYDRFHIKGNRPIVSIMFADHRENLERILRHLRGRDLQFVSLYHHLNWHDRFNPFAPKVLTDLSPYEWHMAFRCYSLNITTYFHGTALALKSNVPTIVLDNTNLGYDYHSKAHQLMADLGLEAYWFANTIHSDEQARRILQAVDFLLDNHDEIAQKIEKSLQLEKGKSESFFTALAGLIN